MDSVIGLDIGSYNLKAVSIQKNNNKNFLKKYYVARSHDLPSKILSDSNDHNKEAAVFLQNFLTENNFETKKVVACLPETKIFSKVITMPVVDEKDFKQSVEWEAERHLPQPLSDVYLKYTPIKYNNLKNKKSKKSEVVNKLAPTLSAAINKNKEDNDNEGTVDVLIVAVSRQLVDKYLAVFERIDMQVMGLEPVSISTIRGAMSPDDSIPTVIVNIGYGGTDFYLVMANTLRFVRSISLGVGSLNRAIAKELDISEFQANEYLYTYGFSPTELNGKIKEIILPVFNILLDEFHKSENYIEQRGFIEGQDKRVKRVVLSGGGALIPDIVLYLVKEIKPEVQYAQAWKQLDLSGIVKKDPAFDQLSPMFAPAVGAALKES